MGLKTTNYTVHELGITLPSAYAILNDIKIENGWVLARFFVQSTREAATKLRPIEIVPITFKFNRNENPVEAAYNFVKGKMKDYDWNEEKGVHEEVEAKMPFYGWQDDFVQE